MTMGEGTSNIILIGCGLLSKLSLKLSPLVNLLLSISILVLAIQLGINLLMGISSMGILLLLEADY